MNDEKVKKEDDGDNTLRVLRNVSSVVSACPFTIHLSQWV